MAFETQIKVRFGDEDHARIVYYPRFFHFFHCAFEDFFDEQGYPYRECLDGDGVGWPAVQAHADFERPVRFGEVITVRLTIPRIGTKSITFDYVVTRPDGERACTGRVVVACIGMDDYAGRPIPDKYRALFEKHLEP
ncbi:MAG: acyl-CoA thioesterase [Sandaracinaceae bacterium]|nr:acyl-CoA thioesterase [Sandaracinaceae bacterium]